ncbi:MAG: hypothetical protein ACRDMX_03570 [Solirubrobacteraceae bacterium]
MTPARAARLLATGACCAGAAILVLAAPGLASADAAPRPPALSVTGAALYAPATGQLLYGVNPRRRLPIASTTKLMTALITLRHVHRLSTVFTQTDWYPASDDSQIGLVPGERMSVHDLLIALLLPSADDAAEDLAYNIGGGSVARFVAMMNAQARALALRDTHYSTPIGLDTPDNYSSAADLDLLAAYDMTHSAFFARVVALGHAVLRLGDEVREVVNRDDLVGSYPWIDGVKTGHTARAGYVLVSSAHRDGLWLVGAVLGTDSEQSRDVNALALMDYGYARFRVWAPVRAGEPLARVRVAGQPGSRATLVAARSFTRVLPRTDRLRVREIVSRRLSAPLPRGAVVGRAIVTDGRRVLARVPLALSAALAASPPSAGSPTPATGTAPLATAGYVRVSRALRLAAQRWRSREGRARA